MNHDLIQMNRFSVDFNGNDDVIFCKIDPELIMHEFAVISKTNKKVIMISGNSDNCIENYYLDRIPHNLHKWFSANVNTTHPKIIPIPFGIGNSFECAKSGHGVGYDYNYEKCDILSSLVPPTPIYKDKLYANFNIHTNLDVRIPVRQICEQHPQITFDEPNLPYTEFITRARNHAAVVCPPGNGGDGHRIYEILYAGCIPISFKVSRFAFILSHFDELPIVYLNSFDELRDVDRVLHRVEKVRNNPKTILSYNYWHHKISEAIHECRDNG